MKKFIVWFMSPYKVKRIVSSNIVELELLDSIKNTFGSKYKQNKKILELSRKTKKKLTGTSDHRRERKI